MTYVELKSSLLDQVVFMLFGVSTRKVPVAKTYIIEQLNHTTKRLPYIQTSGCVHGFFCNTSLQREKKSTTVETLRVSVWACSTSLLGNAPFYLWRSGNENIPGLDRHMSDELGTSCNDEEKLF